MSVKTKTALSEIKYPKVGMPFSIRANMSGAVGQFMAFGEIPLGKKLTFTPIAYRMFRGTLFQKREHREAGIDGTKNWLELFFPYEYKGNTVLACLGYHGFSVESFVNGMMPFMYEFDEKGDSLDVTDLTITATFEPHTNDKGDKYFIGKFEMEPADRELVKEGQILADSLDIFRAETVGSEQTLLGEKNFPSMSFLKNRGLLSTSAVQETEETK